jgi:hypothetical protein
VDDAGARTAARALGQLFHAAHDDMRAQVRGLDRGTLSWRPLPIANSIAALVAHSLGSEREMIRAVRSLTTERDRDAEFKVEATADELLALLDRADHELDEHLDAVTASDLTDLRARGDRPPRPGLDWLVSNYGHLREHLAQIELTRQLHDSRD